MLRKSFRVHLTVLVLIMLTIAFPSNLSESSVSQIIFGTRTESKDIVNVSEHDLPPVAIAGKDLTVQINEPMHFNSSGTNDDKGVLNYSWTFEYLGTEIHLYGPGPEFIFKEIGYYEVNLTVTDREGNLDYDQMNVTVENYKEKVRFATFLGIGFAGVSFLGLMVWSFIHEIKQKRIRRKKEK